jgi:hypothetical protein
MDTILGFVGVYISSHKQVFLIVSVKVQLVRKGLGMHVTVAVVSEAASFSYQ